MGGRENLLRVISFWGGAAGACLPEFEQVHGARVLYENSGELEPCAGNADYADKLVPFLEAQLAVTAPQPLRYSWLTDRDVPNFFTRSEGSLHLGGSVVGQHAWGEDPVMVHEIAHLVAGSSSSAPFFNEGIAVAVDILSDIGGGPRYVDEITFDPRTTMTATKSIGVDYGAAGLFVTFLLVRHGPERVRDFHRALVWPFTLERIDAAFRRIFGVTLDAEVEIFMKGPPPCEESYFNLQLAECMGPSIPWEDERTWRLAETLACDTPGVVGGIGPSRAWPDFHTVTLTVTAPGVYGLMVETTGREWVRFGPCFGCPWDFKDEVVFAEELRPIRLAAGKYYLRVNGSSDEVSEIDVTLRFIY